MRVRVRVRFQESLRWCVMVTEAACAAEAELFTNKLSSFPNLNVHVLNARVGSGTLMKLVMYTFLVKIS